MRRPTVPAATATLAASFAMTFATMLTALFAATASAQSVAITPRFQEVGHFHNGLAPAQLNDRWGFIDTRGDWVVSPVYDGVLRGNNGRFGILENGRWGFIDAGGEIIVPPAYDKAKPFSDGVAAVKRAGLWGFISTSGAIETALEFTEINGREGQLFPGRKPGDDWRIMRATVGLKAAPFRATYSNENSAFRAYLQDQGGFARPSHVHGSSEGAAIAVFDQGEALLNTSSHAGKTTSTANSAKMKIAIVSATVSSERDQPK